MKLIEKIEKATQEKRYFWSFEYFPPRTPVVCTLQSNDKPYNIKGVRNLYDRMERMYSYGPEFVDVTWGIVHS